MLVATQLGHSPAEGDRVKFFITAPDRNDLYWRPERRGYTTSLAQAGVYEEREALSIQRMDRGDKAILVSDKADELLRLYQQAQEDVPRLRELLVLSYE